MGYHEFNSNIGRCVASRITTGSIPGRGLRPRPSPEENSGGGNMCLDTHDASPEAQCNRKSSNCSSGLVIFEPDLKLLVKVVNEMPNVD